ncbi:hypothetical protein [Stenotrophomonas maltophilia]|uniref:hypothetical protein n=1 Tax=Stenotrophomonas maltophilia TaxID=40324 RepID=UPI000C144FC4|nr:hypothetical protein [Stenotrophomonas maltophilia]
MTTDNKTLADVQPGGRVRLGNGLTEAVAQALATVNEAANDARHAGNYKVANALVTARVTLSKQLLALSAQPSPGGQGDTRIPFETWAKDGGFDVSKFKGIYNSLETRAAWGAWLYWQRRSAQPSPGGQGDDSPMAKMAAALRGKAEAERAAFDQRVQSGEWGPMPDNPDVLELPPLPEEVDSVRCMIRGEKGFAEPCDYYFTSKQMRDYARTALAASQPVGEPVAEVVDVGGVRKLRVYPDEGLPALLQFSVGTKFYTAPPVGAK